MANLKDLIVTGVGRFVDKVYASEFIGKLTGNADTATKATQDASGNIITSTYATKAQIADAVYSDDSDEYTATVPLNADTLGGKLPSDYAPAGFGLGGEAKKLTSADNLNNAWQSGNYWWDSHVPVNAPIFNSYTNGMFSFMRVDGLGDGTFKQTVWSYFSDIAGQCMTRYCTEEWEWVNPPMIPGVEYRTTERWNGKPVWTVLINCGAYADNRYIIDTNYSCEYVIDARGRLGYSMLPRLRDTFDGSLRPEIVNSNGKISVIVRGGNAGNNECIVQVWYTKYD